jgi:hypothetical protein
MFLIKKSYFYSKNEGFRLSMLLIIGRSLSFFMPDFLVLMTHLANVETIKTSTIANRCPHQLINDDIKVHLQKQKNGSYPILSRAWAQSPKAFFLYH